jgi:hypothetical protein
LVRSRPPGSNCPERHLEPGVAVRQRRPPNARRRLCRLPGLPLKGLRFRDSISQPELDHLTSNQLNITKKVETKVLFAKDVNQAAIRCPNVSIAILLDCFFQVAKRSVLFLIIGQQLRRIRIWVND